MTIFDIPLFTPLWFVYYAMNMYVLVEQQKSRETKMLINTYQPLYSVLVWSSVINICYKKWLGDEGQQRE